MDSTHEVSGPGALYFRELPLARPEDRFDEVGQPARIGPDARLIRVDQRFTGTSILSMRRKW